MSLWAWLLGREPAAKPATPDAVVMPKLPAAAPLFPATPELTGNTFPVVSAPRATGSKAEAAKASRGYRNKNPGNIDWLPPGRAWNGQVAKETGSGARFGVYDTHENGIRAIGRQLLKYQESYDLHTIRQIVNQWAPPVENATNHYITRVDAAMTRHGADDRLDLRDYLQLRALVEAIIIVECGGNPYDPSVIDLGVRRALA